MKKKKSIKKRALKLLFIIFLSILSLMLVINIPIITLSNKTSDTDYSSWMKDTIPLEQKVIDVTMLGAHDAFSNEINIFSEVDEYSADSIMQGITGVLIKGFIVKQSVTQLDPVDELLKSGVRYLDVRLTYESETWYTKHNYISGEFIPIVTKIKTFLEDNPGEFLILDFQHIHGLDYDDVEDYNTFKDMLIDSGLMDFSYEANDLTTLTYGELTGDRAESKVIIISKFADSEGKILYYDDSLRSNWANSDNFEEVKAFLEQEALDITTSSTASSKFRVMQAVATMQMNPAGILDGLIKWSLINRAKQFNSYLVNSEEFSSIIQELPIVMVDYSNTNYGEFNDEIMQIIMDSY